jgi:hypothetical protein
MLLPRSCVVVVSIPSNARIGGYSHNSQDVNGGLENIR